MGMSCAGLQHSHEISIKKKENCILDRHNRQQDEEALFNLLLCRMLDLSFQSLAGTRQDYAQLATNVNNTTMLTPLRILKFHCLPSKTESERMHFMISLDSIPWNLNLILDPTFLKPMISSALIIAVGWAVMPPSKILIELTHWRVTRTVLGCEISAQSPS